MLQSEQDGSEHLFKVRLLLLSEYLPLLFGLAGQQKLVKKGVAEPGLATFWAQSEVNDAKEYRWLGPVFRIGFPNELTSPLDFDCSSKVWWKWESRVADLQPNDLTFLAYVSVDMLDA